MQETWNKFVFDLYEAKKKNMEENGYHSLIETQFQLLGWAKYNGEICHKPTIPIGNNQSIQPDILIKKDGEEQFVIEVKRPLHTLRERERQQLVSYMRQLKLQVGVYIGEHIEVFYDQPNNKDAVSVLKVDLELDSAKGAKFIELFSKKQFDKADIESFCEERIKEMQRQESLNKIKESLVSEDGGIQIKESVKLYLAEKYKDAFSEEEIDKMLSALMFKAMLIETECSVPPIIEKQIQPLTVKEKSSTKQKDYTRYALNAGEPLRKNHFALEVVKEYMRLYPQTHFEDIKRVFPDDLQNAGCGVIRSLDSIEQKKQKRYFTKQNDILISGDNIHFAVTTQWGINNIPNMIEKAKSLGFTVKPSDTKKRK